MDWHRLRRRRGRPSPAIALALALALLALAACGGGPTERRPVCSAQDTLRGALRAVAAAQAAERAGDRAGVERQLTEVERLLRVARADLAGAASDPDVGAAERGLLEAANYLDFMVGDYRASGRVDFAMTQFASRELNRAVSGGGGAPLNC